MPRADSAAIEERDPELLPGRDRHALLLLRKHLDGRRLLALRRVPGRVVVLDFGGPLVALRLRGTPALTLVLEGEAVATLGEGAPAWPSTADAELEDDAGPERGPAVRLPGPLASCHDRDLAPAAAVSLAAGGDGVVVATATWLEAAALFLVARRRGARFASAQQAALAEARRELRRLARLEANLDKDVAELPEAETLRRQGEALLAAPQRVAAGASLAELPDPYAEGRLVSIALDPRMSAPANADRLFAKARRIERARTRVRERLLETRRALELLRGAEARALAARDASELAPAKKARADGAAGSGPHHYLTGRGLSVLVGRSARENQRLTFALAKPEDLWLHARDVPGSHVIVRDPEGRADKADLREAAELAAFFSDARAEAQVDVHVTRRKHVRAARGAPGRVQVSHSETLRVAPRDPEGRLRKR